MFEISLFNQFNKSYKMTIFSIINLHFFFTTLCNKSTIKLSLQIMSNGPKINKYVLHCRQQVNLLNDKELTLVK